ncbi:hypothetical protein [Actinoplanes sp. L3-i22]|uniref:hypothetical protein n=1 Tax=Actinoplanes sp. L3-i22 TaxID=2836373 RepID=UPI001C773A79|nr:hypothetical protein [Actinoplanes sp. L3-i22]BCY07714.1 hypothetical protein L3i22_028020 [Actinoplanes sp. L3-i22]
MNKLIRGFAMSGLAAAAGLVMTAGPAAASSAAHATPEAKPKAPAAAQAKSRSRVLGFYRSSGACHRDGQRGEFRRQWTDHDCIPVREGFRRGYALKVYYGWGGPGSHDMHDHDHGPHDMHDHGPHGPWKKN